MKRSIVFTLLLGLMVAGFALAGPPQEERRVVIRPGGGTGAWLGVQLRDLNAAELKDWMEPDDLGAAVVKIVAESPAEKAGLAVGDIIVRYAGTPVLGVEHLVHLVRMTPAGKTVALEISRKGKKESIPVTLARRESEDQVIQIPPVEIPEFDVPVPHWDVSPGGDGGPQRRFRFFNLDERPRLGIYYEDLTEQLGRFFGVPDGKGVLVTSVVDDSPAAKAGLLAGDVIVAIEGAKIEDSGDLFKALGEAKETQTLTVQVYRKGKAQDVKITLEPRESKPRGKKMSV